MGSRARSRTARRAELTAALAACAAAAALAAGCGSDDPTPQASAAAPTGKDAVVDISGSGPVGENTAGSVASLVECRDWLAATDEQKQATIDDVRGALVPEDSGIAEQPLTDEEATQVFDASCKPKWARGFRLYKLYAHAAGFVGMKRALDSQG